jgi:hypothetical protein
MLLFLIVISCSWSIFDSIKEKRRLHRCGLQAYTPKKELQAELQAWVDHEHEQLCLTRRIYTLYKRYAKCAVDEIIQAKQK